MFRPGEKIVYGRTGVCLVEEIECWKGQDYYVLKPLFQSCCIKLPVNGKAFMRPIVSGAEADALIDAMPAIEPRLCESRAPREITEFYQTFLANRSCRDLVELTVSLHAKRREAREGKRKFGVVDERILKEGEALLFGELASALSIPMADVPGYIENRLGPEAE